MELNYRFGILNFSAYSEIPRRKQHTLSFVYRKIALRDRPYDGRPRIRPACQAAVLNGRVPNAFAPCCKDAVIWDSK
jgi:hypothetical protein